MAGGSVAGDKGTGSGKMSKRLVVAWLILALNTAWGFQGKQLALGTALKIRWNGKTVIVYDGNKKHNVELNDEVGALEIGSVKLQSAKRSGPNIYLLFDIDGPSRGRAAATSYCGAGSESNLVWVKLDTEWKMEDSQSFLYQSCLFTVEANDPPEWDGAVLKVISNNYSDKIEQAATYSYKQPEQGLKISKEPLKN